jgi:hypothetical protein
MGKLKHTNAFPVEMSVKEDGTKPAIVRRKPFELYEPVDTMRDLGLPVLDWGEGKWKPSSEEGMFAFFGVHIPCSQSARMLFTLGLRRFPPIDVLLGIAAGKSPTNQKALNYLLANLGTHYINYDPKAYAGVAYLPASTPDGRQILAKHGEVSTVATGF